MVPKKDFSKEIPEKDPNQQILEYLSGNPNSGAVEIAQGCGLFTLHVYKFLKMMESEGKVTMQRQDEKKVYSVTNSDAAIDIKSETPTTEIPVEVKPKKKTKVPTDEVKLKTTRDITKYVFNGNSYGKGPLLLAVVKHLVSTNREYTLPDLQKTFPDEMIRPYGVIKELRKAKLTSSGGRDRFFLKQHQLINTADKKVVAVSNQVGAIAFEKLMAIFKTLELDIRKE